MAYILLNIIISTIAVFVAARILPGINIEGWETALIVAIVLGLINAFIRPIIFILTLPINVLTLGLFTLVIMGGIVWVVAALVPGFHVHSFWWAIGFALVLAVINNFLDSLLR